MRKTFKIGLAGAALLALSLSAASAWSQCSSTASSGDWSQLGRLEAELAAQIARSVAALPVQAVAERVQARVQAQLARAQEQLNERLYAKLAGQQAGVLAPPVQGDDVWFSIDGESGWLGVSVEEVSTDKAKEFKLSAVHGALVTEVESDSPAAKAGLKLNDIITDYNGQRVEGTAELRRLIRETPSGRTVQITVWRDGRSQSLSATLAEFGNQMRSRLKIAAPRAFALTPPEMNFSFGDRGFAFAMPSRGPSLGIGVEDLSGQLGNYFGAPDGEGVLVTEVHSGSAAEKAGMKAGDVITKIEGTRVRTSGELRDQLREHPDKKTVSITVLRKGSETSLNVEVEQPKPKTPAAARRAITYRTL